MTTLGEVCEVLDKKRKPITKRDRVAGPYPYYGATGILDYVEDWIFDERLILLGEDGAKWGRNEQSAFIIDGRTWVNNHAHVLNPRRDVVDDRYVTYYLNHVSLDPFISGTTIPKLTQKSMVNIQIPLPPLDEQKRIAGILDEADRVRKKTQALIDKYDELAQSLFLDMFGDPVTNPKGWEVKALGEISESRLGKMLDQKKQTGNELRPYIKNTNVKWFKFKLNELPEMDFDSDDRAEFQLMIGDILVCEGGDVGRCAIWKGEVEECYFQKALHRVRLNSDFLDGNYFKYWMKASSENGVLGAISAAATIPHLTGAKLKKLEIMTPPKERQMNFSVQIDSIERQQSELLRQVESSANLTSALLQKAFKGELT